MKTAMQELIEWLNEIDNSIFALSASPVELKMIGNLKTKCHSLLNKEKEQIRNAWEAGEMFGERVERDGMTTQQVLDRRVEYLTTLS